MTKKKPDKKDEVPFVVKKRQKKAKPDYFANVTPSAHPLADILDFPSQPPEPENPFSPPEKEKIPADKPSEIETTEPEKTETSGQLANQTEANQLTSVVNQLTSQPVNQSVVDQLTDPKNYPSRRNRKLKGLRLPVQKLQKWEMWMFLNKVDFQDAVEMALDWLTSQPVNHVLIDDLEDAGTNDDVLIFYHKWTGNRITQKDKDARETMRKFSDDICKIGIAISIYRTKTKINSFKYCIGAIEEAAETPIQDNQEYLKYLQSAMIGKKKGSRQ
jgi:hypothetical protein